MSIFVVSGAASGMGAATARLLTAQGHKVIGVDLHDADVVADLSQPEGRSTAVAAIEKRAAGRLDGAALFAGMGGATGRAASLLVSLNFFGSVELFTALRPLLSAAGTASAVAIGSNSATVQPGWDADLVAACLSGDEERARTIADRGDSFLAYPATKAALAHWVRRTAPNQDWAGSGIRLNTVAPGLVETPLVEATRNDPVLRGMIDEFPLPLGRGGRPEEIAELVAFLLISGTYFCGSFLVCDGGSEALLRPDAWPARWDL